MKTFKHFLETKFNRLIRDTVYYLHILVIFCPKV